MGKLCVYMAPLQGITEAPFRNAFGELFGGVDVYYTPFVRYEHGGLRKKDLRDLNPEANSVEHLVLQVIAGTAEELETILELVSPYGYKELDLNLGCSFPTIAKKGRGSGLLPYPEKVEALMHVIDSHPELSFSVKMRLGYDNTAESIALLPILNASKLSRVVVHARTGRQQFKEECDRQAFAAFAEGCTHPVVYNGDIMTLADLQSLEEEIPSLQGVMLGRGLLAEPWLAAEYQSGETWGHEERMTALSAFHARLYDHYSTSLEGGDKQVLDKMKSFWEYLYTGGDRKLRKKIHKSQKLTDYTQAVSLLLEE